MFIEVSVVLARAKPSILLLDEEERRGLMGLGFSDFAGLEMLINELLAGIHFLRVEQVCLSHLRDKGVLEVNGMVKGSSGRELSCLGLIEHLGILGILRREFLYNLLGSLSKRGGESDLLDRRVAVSQYSLK